MREFFKRVKGNKKMVMAGGCLLILLVIGILWGLSSKKNIPNTAKKEQPTALQQLNADEKKIVSVYAQLYDVSEEKVAKLKLDTGDWEQVNAKLDTEYFTIGESKKYQMVQEGYDLEDLNMAEKLARKTGKRALDLAKAKGKAEEKKKWTIVLEEEEKKYISELEEETNEK